MLSESTFGAFKIKFLGVAICLASVLSFACLATHAQDTYANALQAQIQRQQQRLSSSDAEERRDAVMSLGAMRSPAASRVAASALNDLSIPVRVAATTAILWLPADESAALLLPLLKDKDIFVRQETAYALGKARSRAGTNPLIALLGVEKDSGVRGAAVVALGQIGDETAVVTLAQILAPEGKKSKNLDNEFVMRAAARSLGQIKSRSGIPALLSAVQNEGNDMDVRREAAEALGQIGAPEAVPVLRGLTTSSDPYLAKAAHDSLKRIANN
jgi:HEAT repeat protein